MPGPPTPPLGKPIGVFWTTTVGFERNLPSPAQPAAGLTSEWQNVIDAAIFLLKIDPTLQVRLIAHASSEDTPAHNLELSKRRARHLTQKLRAAGLWARIVDPVESDGKTDGCSKVEFGVWACGEEYATSDEVRPEERKVELTFLRNPPLLTGPFRLPPPSLLRP